MERRLWPHAKKRKIIRRLLRRDGLYCQLCRGQLSLWQPDLTLDHIVPKSRGGPDNSGNLRLAHKSCNERRGTYPDAEWWARQ